MKKTLTLIALGCSLSTFAQRQMDINVTIVTPANNANIPVGTPFTAQYVFKNQGPSTVLTTDTIIWADPATPANQVYFRTGKSLAVNDTIQVNRSLNVNATTPNGPLNFCVIAQPFNRTSAVIDQDTLDNRVCRTLNVTGSTGIGNVLITENVVRAQLSTFPNPANDFVKLDFVAQNSSAVHIRIMDITGRIVSSVEAGAAYKGKTGYSVNVSELVSGIYLIEAIQDDYRAVGKFVKQ